MQNNTPLPTDSTFSVPAAADRAGRYIYIACPWSPVGGGMYKVADYLIQAQAPQVAETAAELRPLDTRGPGPAWASIASLCGALSRLVRGRLDGRLAGVHVNMAERLSLLRKGVVVVACHVLGVPVVIHLHAQMRGFFDALPAPLRVLVRWMFSLASDVIVIGAASREFVIEELDVPARRVSIVINGVPGPAVAPPLQPERDVKHIVFVGRLCEAKGVSELLRALATGSVDVSRVRVTIAGGGDLATYQAKAASLGMSDVVKFAGWCDQPQVDALLADADVLVLPSHDEVLPLVVLEALANSVPVVCTPVGELPAVLKDGVNALFVPVGDAQALGATLARVVDDRPLREWLAVNGRLLYDQQFSLRRFFSAVARIHRRHFGVAGQLPDTKAAEVAQ